MKISSSFQAPASSARAWDLLMDVPRVVPCMPGAQLQEIVGDDRWRIEIGVTLGPVAMTFDTDLTRTVVDPDAGSVTLVANGREVRGRGEAQATIVSRLTQEGPDSTAVDVETDLALTGVVAQYGGGVVSSVSRQLVAQFADALRDELASSDSSNGVHTPSASKKNEPVRGLSLLIRALWDSLLRALRIRRN